jgi:hypothetical protein
MTQSPAPAPTTSPGWTPRAASYPTGGGRAGRGLVMLQLLLLTLEFLLGTWVGLYYTSLPSSTQAAVQNGGSMPALAAHIGLAIVMVIVAIAIVAWAIVRHRPRLAAAGFVGLIGVVAASVAGYEFLMHPKTPAFAFDMALGFILAYISYFAAAATTRMGPRPAVGDTLRPTPH